MWVVKLGGSLMKSGQLSEWLKQLKKHGSGKVVIVPGGGPFADHIRNAQEEWGFDNSAAHHMALLAMEQYAFYCQSLLPELETASKPEQIHKLIEQNKIVIFLAHQFMAEQKSFPEDWSLTSDSIAALISGILQADGLILIKSITKIAKTDTVQDLARLGVVDEFFPGLCQGLNGEIHCLTAKDYHKLEKLISG